MSSDFYYLLSFPRSKDAGDAEMSKNNYFTLDDFSSDNCLLWMYLLRSIFTILAKKDQQHYNILKQRIFSATY